MRVVAAVSKLCDGGAMAEWLLAAALAVASGEMKKGLARASAGVGWLQGASVMPGGARRVASVVSQPSTRGAHASGVF